MPISPASPWPHRCRNCATWRLIRRVDSDSNRLADSRRQTRPDFPIGAQGRWIASELRDDAEGPDVACLETPGVDALVQRQEQRAREMKALRDDDQLRLAIDLAR